MTTRPRGRAIPPQPESCREQEHAERVAALLSLDPATIRAWAARWNVPLLPTDDEGLLATAHVARLRDDAIPVLDRLASVQWLAQQGDPIGIAVLNHLAAHPDLSDPTRVPQVIRDALQGTAPA